MRRVLVLLVLVTIPLAVPIAGCSADGPRGGGSETARAGRTSAGESERPPDTSRILKDEPVARVAAEVGPSVVQVNVDVAQQTPFGTEEGEGLGSGVIYREDGYVITNDHVVRGGSNPEVAFADGTTEPARIVGADPNSEIAVLKVDRDDLPAAGFATDTPLLVGQLAVAIGSPAGFEATVTSGVISGLSREFPEELVGNDASARRSLSDLIQTDAAISPGNSGGALVDRDGNIIGINVAYLPPSQTGAVNLGFAIPSDTATSIADQLIETGEVTTPYLGVGTADLTPEIAERFNLPVDSGAFVRTVEPDSSARAAGVRRGDVITALGGEEVESYGDLVGALRDYRPGDTARLTVARDGGRRTLEVRLDERPR